MVGGILLNQKSLVVHLNTLPSTSFSYFIPPVAAKGKDSIFERLTTGELPEDHKDGIFVRPVASHPQREFHRFPTQKDGTLLSVITPYTIHNGNGQPLSVKTQGK